MKTKIFYYFWKQIKINVMSYIRVSNIWKNLWIIMFESFSHNHTNVLSIVAKTAWTTGGTRTRNPRLSPRALSVCALPARRPMPYPLGHGGSVGIVRHRMMCGTFVCQIVWWHTMMSLSCYDVTITCVKCGLVTFRPTCYTSANYWFDFTAVGYWHIASNVF